MAWQVLLTRPASKELDALPRRVYFAIYKKILQLADDPFPTGCVKLDDGIYRIRIGEYRAIYSAVADTQTILISRVARRSEKTYRDF